MLNPAIEELVAKLEQLPTDRVAEVIDFVDFLHQRTQAKPPPSQEPLDFPVISVGAWPQNLSLRRDDMYGDDGR